MPVHSRDTADDGVTQAAFFPVPARGVSEKRRLARPWMQVSDPFRLQHDLRIHWDIARLMNARRRSKEDHVVIGNLRP